MGRGSTRGGVDRPGRGSRRRRTGWLRRAVGAEHRSRSEAVSTEDELVSEPAAPDPLEALLAHSICLRDLACGYGLLPVERSACLSILRAGLPGVDATERSAVQKTLAASRRPSGRRRDQASQLSIRFAEVAEALRARTLNQ